MLLLMKGTVSREGLGLQNLPLCGFTHLLWQGTLTLMKTLSLVSSHLVSASFFSPDCRQLLGTSANEQVVNLLEMTQLNQVGNQNC